MFYRELDQLPGSSLVHKVRRYYWKRNTFGLLHFLNNLMQKWSNEQDQKSLLFILQHFYFFTEWLHVRVRSQLNFEIIIVDGDSGDFKYFSPLWQSHTHFSGDISKCAPISGPFSWFRLSSVLMLDADNIQHILDEKSTWLQCFKIRVKIKIIEERDSSGAEEQVSLTIIKMQILRRVVQMGLGSKVHSENSYFTTNTITSYLLQSDSTTKKRFLMD